MNKPLISLSSICKQHSKRNILQNINFDIFSNELVAVIGSSGCGKTSLLKCISGIEAPSSGTIEVFGQKAPKSKEDWQHLYPEITYMFQSIHLWPHLTLRQNIEIPLQNYFKDNISWKSNLEALLTEFEVERITHLYPREASGGECQRIGIIRAFLLNPKVILMDEVTSALGVNHISTVLKQALNFKKKGGAAIFVTHHLEFAFTLADKVVFISQGKITDYGSPQELLKSPSQKLREFLDESLIFNINNSYKIN